MGSSRPSRVAGYVACAVISATVLLTTRCDFLGDVTELVSKDELRPATIALEEGVQPADPALTTPKPVMTQPAYKQVPAAPSAGDTVIRTIDRMAMVYVPAGTFVMGSAEGREAEMPVHDVTVDAVWMDRTEVSNAQYQACVVAGRCAASAFAEDPDYGAPDLSVVGVTWFQAYDYCAWVGARLPTEAEWEYAARGPEGTIYPWGNDLRDGAANCDESVCQDGYEVAAPVGSFPEGASWVGALDMAGNVWEWVADWGEVYPSTQVTNPAGPDTGQVRVMRGGDWDNDEDYMRSTFREVDEPTQAYYTLGFRCASAERP